MHLVSRITKEKESISNNFFVIHSLRTTNYGTKFQKIETRLAKTILSLIFILISNIIFWAWFCIYIKIVHYHFHSVVFFFSIHLFNSFSSIFLFFPWPFQASCLEKNCIFAIIYYLKLMETFNFVCTTQNERLFSIWDEEWKRKKGTTLQMGSYTVWNRTTWKEYLVREKNRFCPHVHNALTLMKCFSFRFVSCASFTI